MRNAKIYSKALTGCAADPEDSISRVATQHTCIQSRTSFSKIIPKRLFFDHKVFATGFLGTASANDFTDDPRKSEFAMRFLRIASVCNGVSGNFLWKSGFCVQPPNDLTDDPGYNPLMTLRTTLANLSLQRGFWGLPLELRSLCRTP